MRQANLRCIVASAARTTQALRGMLAALAVCMTAPAAHAATTATATAQAAISNVVVNLVALDGAPWIVQNTGPGWPAQGPATGVTTDLAMAGLSDRSAGWIGGSRNAAVESASNAARASISFTGADLFSAGAASSFASASGGEVASATARLWDAAFMVGGRTRVVVTMTLDSLSVAGHGGTAMALASLGIWSNSLNTNAVSAEAQAIDSPDFSVAYSGPTTLSVSWDNPSTDLVIGQISLLTSAQVLSA
ncbi:hypothetical protein DBR42_14920, partial [Pelomonas sp. HMWF004]